MTIKIDLFNLDTAHRHLLAKLFAENPEKIAWSAGSYFVDSQEIILSHKIIKHLNLTHEKIVYEVLDNEVFAKGCFGSLYLSLATLVPDKLTKDFTVKIKPEEKQRLVKIQEVKYCSHENAQKEVTNLQKIGFFHCKPLSFDENQSFITMRKVAAIPLSQLIADNKLSIQERYQLSLAVLIAWKEQVHNHDLIHRDIKPENILIHSEFTARFVDYALAISQNYDDRYDVLRGSIPYAAPENFTSYAPTTIQSDIYALGRVLMMIWGDNYFKNPNFAPNDVLFSANHVSFDTLFDRMDEIPSCHNKLRSLFVSMLRAEPSSRPNFDEIISILNALSDNLQPIAKPKESAALTKKIPHFASEYPYTKSDVKSPYGRNETDDYEEGYNSYYGF